MTEATSSRSSTFGQQYAGDLDPHRRCISGSSLEVPEDILELLKESGWDNTEDLNSARKKYTNMLLDGEKYPNLNIEKDLEMLKGLSSSLERKFYISLEEYRLLGLKYQDKFQSLVKKLVEQVPNIKDLPGYEHLTTEREKILIEQALQEKGQEVKLEPQVVDPALVFHLEDLHKELMPLDEKYKVDVLRFQKIDRLRSMVDDLIRIVTIIKQSWEADKRIKQSWEAEKRNSGGGDEKRKKHQQSWEAEKCNSGRYDNKKRKHQKLVDKKEVEEGLLKVLKEVSGKKLESHVVDRFRMKWDYMVDQFIMVINYLN